MAVISPNITLHCVKWGVQVDIRSSVFLALIDWFSPFFYFQIVLLDIYISMSFLHLIVKASIKINKPVNQYFWFRQLDFTPCTGLMSVVDKIFRISSRNRQDVSSIFARILMWFVSHRNRSMNLIWEKQNNCFDSTVIPRRQSQKFLQWSKRIFLFFQLSFTPYLLSHIEFICYLTLKC